MTHLAPPPASILVCEDLDDDFDTVEEAARLAELPHPIVRIRTLAEMQTLLSDGPRPPFTFVLLDVNLPDGAGVDLVRTLRTDRELGTIPIVVFSTSDNPRDLRQLYSAGINAYHVKALRHRENLAMLTTIFRYWLHSARLLDDA